MKIYGNVNFQQNAVKQLALSVETEFPDQPVVGRVVFKNKVVYICVDLAGGVPAWVPLTNEIDTYIHNQGNPSATWTFQHNLNSGTVQVQVYDGDGYTIVPDNIQIVDRNTVTITFGTAQGGRAVAMVGSMTGNQKPSVSYEHQQTNPSTSWVVDHYLGFNPIVRVFIGNQEVQPESVTHDSVNRVTITFSSPQTGYVRLV